MQLRAFLLHGLAAVGKKAFEITRCIHDRATTQPFHPASSPGKQGHKILDAVLHDSIYPRLLRRAGLPAVCVAGARCRELPRRGCDPAAEGHNAARCARLDLQRQRQAAGQEQHGMEHRGRPVLRFKERGDGGPDSHSGRAHCRAAGRRHNGGYCVQGADGVQQGYR